MRPQLGPRNPMLETLTDTLKVFDPHGWTQRDALCTVKMIITLSADEKTLDLPTAEPFCEPQHGGPKGPQFGSSP